MRPINLLVIHCSATKNGQPIARGSVGTSGFKSTPAVIDSWHAERGFQRTAPTAKTFNPHLQHIGYHFVITTDGAVFTGRAPEEVGAHAVNANANSLGICMVGTDTFTQKQWDALKSLVTRLCAEYKIPLAFARRAGPRLFDGICGHRDTSPDKDGDGKVEPFEWLKTCPGFDVAKWINYGMTPDSERVVK
jgi:N-acetylmuramoyl-L-alanine amidase